MTKTRTETDSFGPIEVPADAYWGAQTQRSIANFPFPPHERMPMGIIHALGAGEAGRGAGESEAWAGCARLPMLSRLPRRKSLSGQHDDQFPLTIWQTGSGTQSNMNVNEVIAGSANEMLTGTRGGKSPVHPNDHVNMSQSSNDSFPTAMHVAASLAVSEQLICGSGSDLHAALDANATKRGRTSSKSGARICRMPRRLLWVRNFPAYVSKLLTAADAYVASAVRRTDRLAQGGTAVGTGLNAPPNFCRRICAANCRIDRPCHSKPPRINLRLWQRMMRWSHLSGMLNTLAVSLTKIANDIRLLGSGPRSGLGELSCPKTNRAARSCRARSTRPSARC